MSLPPSFPITLHFLSDWHVGTGQGRLGTVDAELRRDGNGLPFVPAKTLIGVWRDACETVAATFDRATPGPADHDGLLSGPWSAWIPRIFGAQSTVDPEPVTGAGRTPMPAALRVTPARVPEWLGRWVHSRPRLAQAAVILRPGVQVDDDTGTASDRLLRVEERALRGMRLVARVSLAGLGGHTELPEPAELLLRAGARLIDGIGGKRNRGAGRVAILLPGVTLDDTGPHPTTHDPRLRELLANGVPEVPPPPAPVAAAAPHPYDRRHDGGYRTVRIGLRALTPVVAAQEVLGNVIIGGDRVPGTALLGAMLSRIDSPHGKIALADLRVGDAVPAADDGRKSVPSLPAPRVWYRSDKGQGQTVSNVLIDRAGARTARAKPMAGRITATALGWQRMKVTRTATTHAVIDDLGRRPTVASGGVYSYVGLAAGTALCCDVVLPVTATLRLAAGAELRLGRSRKDDYGQLIVTRVTELPQPEPEPPVAKGTVRVWCVSDVLLRDERLAPDPSPRALARALSEYFDPATFTVAVDASEFAVTRRDGFGVAWGRPRSSQVALLAGSVVTLDLTGVDRLDPDRVAALHQLGIGERSTEGYGRIRLNPAELSECRPEVAFTEPAEPAPGDDASVLVDPDPAGLAGPPRAPHPIELNAWRRAIVRASAGLLPETLIPGITELATRRAQLGALRAQLERLTLPDGYQLVTHWLDGTEAVRARREAWQGSLRLKELRALLIENHDLIWQRLGLAGEQPDLVLAPGREAMLRGQLRTEALTIAVTDALRRLIRSDQDASPSTAEEQS